MIAVGVGGTYLVVGTPMMTLNQLKTLTYGTFSNYSFSIIPLFLLMGQFATLSGMSAALFRAAESFLGHRRGGVAMAVVGACAGFGAATLVFAVSSHFWLSVAALFATGAFDSVSVVIRQTLLQIYTPDALRGRVQAVNSVFISTSNEIGAFESGLAAKLLGAVPSVVFGGAMTLGITGFIGRRTRSLLALRVQPDA